MLSILLALKPSSTTEKLYQSLRLGDGFGDK
jgi:hypothetical protein